MQTHLPGERECGDLLPTRRSLLSRLKTWDDQESWREFFNTYWKLIYSVAVKAGLSDQEAEDVVQETVLSVAKKMGEFRYDPAVCSFKGWLLRITRFRIIDQLRKRPPGGQRRTLSRTSGGTTTLDRIPDPASLELDSVWEAEWERNLVDAALDRVKRKVKAAHYQIFYWYAVKGEKALKVARMAGANIAQVYIVKQRVSRLLKEEMKRLETDRI